jgi:hypothetical protein
MLGVCENGGRAVFGAHDTQNCDADIKWVAANTHEYL